MFSALGPIKKGLCKYLKYQEIQTDNFLFRLHCVFTAVTLVTASIILTSTQLVGSPIECITSGRDDWHYAINTYCWCQSTFLMPEGASRYKNYGKPESTGVSSLILALTQEIRNELRKKNENNRALEVVESMPYPGMINAYDSLEPPKHYTYYQWVCFILFLQAIMCYLPKVIWDMCEGGLVAKLASGMHLMLCGTEERKKKIDTVIGYFIRYRRRHKMYALVQWGCEGLCLVNVLAQMFLMDTFLGGEFLGYGSKVISQMHQPQHERFDKLIYIFPRMTKCTFYYYGPSGTPVNVDSLCVLPLNVINEKIYVGLWFWYIILGYMLLTLVLYRVTMASIPSVRPRLLAVRSRSKLDGDAVLCLQHLDFGDWWMFYVLGKNMSPIVFSEFILEYSRRDRKKLLYASEPHNPQTTEPLYPDIELLKTPL